MDTSPRRWKLATFTIAALMMAAGLRPLAQSGAQTLLQDAFRGPSSTSAVLRLNTGAPALPCLTADPAAAPGSTIPNCNLPAPDPVGQGALRLTDAAQQQASGVMALTSLPTAQGLSISFTQYQYGGYGLGGPGSPGGGDGISILLAVAPPAPQVLGPQGGALGYASAGSTPGLPGGWLGIGLDAFGNFSNPIFGDPACPVPSWAGVNADSVTVRGPGHGTSGYCLVESSANDIANTSMPRLPALAAGTSLRGVDRASAARRVTVQITPQDGLFRVSVDDGAGGLTQVTGPLPTSYYDPTSGALVPGIPPRITFGFAASTGSATDIHEITDLTATTVTGAVPVLGLTKSTSLSAPPQAGQAFDYVITPRVDIAAEPDPLTLQVTDALPAGVTASALPTGTDWQCASTTATAFACSYTNPSPIPAGTTLPPITLPVTLDATLAPGTSIVNTATALSDNAAGPVTASVTTTVATPTPLTITTTSIPGGTQGTAYSVTLAATGGSGARTWNVSAGALPSGVTLSPAGVLGGTPTAAGTFTFTARVADASGADTQALSLVVNPSVSPLTITTTSLPGGTVGAAYSATLAATGGSGARTWTIAAGTLPAGLGLTTAGVISGQPTSAVTSTFTVRVADASGGVATRALSIVVVPAAPPLVITSTSPLPPSEVAVRYSFALAAAGGTTPYRWTVVLDSVPAGLAMSAAGVIGGVPTTTGGAAFTVRVTDAASRTAQRRFWLSVRAPLAIVTTSVPQGSVTTPYRTVLARSGGMGPYRWTLASGSLPAGLTLSVAGVISGTPTMAGTERFTVRVTDALGGVATRQLRLVIRQPQKAYIGGTRQCTGVHGDCAGIVRVVNLETGRQTRTIVLPGRVSGIGVYVVASPAGNKVAAVTYDLSSAPMLSIIDTATDVILQSLPWLGSGLPAFSHDGSTLYFERGISGTTQVALMSLDTSTFQEQLLATQPVPTLGRLLVAPDGNTIYSVKLPSNSGSATTDAAVLTYSRTGALLQQLALGTFDPYGAALTPNGGRMLVSGRFLNTPSQFWLLDISTSSNAVADQIPTVDLVHDLVAPDDATLWGIQVPGDVVDYSLVTNTLTRQFAANATFMAADPSSSGSYAVLVSGATYSVGRLDIQGGGFQTMTPVFTWPGGGFLTSLAVAKGR